MMSVSGILLAMSIAALFPAAILYLANLFTASKRVRLVAHGTTLAGWILLTAGLIARLTHEGLPSFAGGLQALLIIAWALLLLHLLQALRWDLPGLGAVVTPMALVALFITTALPSQVPPAERSVLASQWMRLHILSIVISMILLILAACCAVLWLAQHHMLKAKRWAGAFRRLPPLELVDGLSYFLAALGFAGLTVGVLTAVVWSVTHPAQPEIQNILTRLAATFSWLLYAFYLWAHTRAKWRGKRAHYILVAGCIAILLTTSFHRWFLSGSATPSGHSSRPTAVSVPRS